MSQYISFMKDKFNEFENYRTKIKCWSKNYPNYLKAFDKYCALNYPTSENLTQEMVDNWCKKRDTETNKSHNNRINVIIGFIAYASSHNIANLIAPENLKVERNRHRPYAFKDIELQRFFYHCDNIELKTITVTKTAKNQQLTLPVFYRLLYSTGMRPIEARMLKVEDIDLETGVINIRKTKGYNQHYVVVNDKMKKYLINYNNKISTMYENRTYFFPSVRDGHHTARWVECNFRTIWALCSKNHAVAYDFRHNYAIVNINSWINMGVEFEDKLYYLSKSMGHSSIETTKYYYSLVPKLANIFFAQINQSFDEIVPEVYDDEN